MQKLERAGERRHLDADFEGARVHEDKLAVAVRPEDLVGRCGAGRERARQDRSEALRSCCCGGGGGGGGGG
jgi:hypothetical protein